MRALMAPGTTGHEPFVVAELPDPLPAAGQVRIRMAGAAVNQADLHVIDAMAGGDPARRTGLGLDVAGVVDRLGAGVDGFDLGAPVAALHFAHAPHATAGAAAEYVVVPASDAAPVPDGIALPLAATVPLNSLTAAQLLPLLGSPRGRRLLVTGAAGGLGGYAVALAARAGWRVTGLARTEDADFLSRAGAEETITDIRGAGRFDAAFDAALLGAQALAAVAEQGVYVGVFPGREPATERGITIRSGVVAPDGRLLRDMMSLTVLGVLEARLAGTLPLGEAARAYDALRSGRQRGRWVLTP